MKRILVKQESTIDFNEIDDSSFVGIHWEGGSKTMIINTPEGFCGISNQVRPNILNVWYTKSIKEYVKRAINQGNNTNSNAYAFDHVLELYEWMSKE
jgi:hypothetical protein